VVDSLTREVSDFFSIMALHSGLHLVVHLGSALAQTAFISSIFLSSFCRGHRQSGTCGDQRHELQ
jgi:hypothetical protein